jgi:hypothetical protein
MNGAGTPFLIETKKPQALTTKSDASGKTNKWKLLQFYPGCKA